MREFCHVYTQACCDEAYMSSIFSFMEEIHPDFCSSCGCLRSHHLSAPHILFGSYSRFVFWFDSYSTWGEMEYSRESSDIFVMNKSYMLMWRLEVNPRCHSSGDVVTSVCLRQAFSPGPWLISESQRSTCLHLPNTELQAQTTTLVFDAFRCWGLNSGLRP